MRVLFLHQNFPGQFLHVAHALRKAGSHELLAVTDARNQNKAFIPTRTYAFTPKRLDDHPLADHYAQRVGRGQAVADVLMSLRQEGFVPDLVVGHGGWGETLFVKDVWPQTKVLLHAEFYYAADGADVGFDPEFGDDPRKNAALRFRIRSRNASMLQALTDADLGLSPTQWQASRFPLHLQPRIKVVHEGIDTARACPNPGASITLRRENLTLRTGDEVITFVNRNFEPYRGCHVFLRTLPEILRRRPNAHVLLVGGDDSSYGPAPPRGTNWRKIFLDEVRNDLDMNRVHFLGRLPHETYLRVLQVSAAHVYLTYPFVLSWSMLEALSVGALVIASATPPVEEVIEHGRNGLLFPFFEGKQLAERVVDALVRPEIYAGMREAARKCMQDRYDLGRVCLPEWMRLLELVVTKDS